MPLDLVLRRAGSPNEARRRFDIGIANGRIVDDRSRDRRDAREEPLDGRLVIPGFVETHIHLDKSCILDRCPSAQGRWRRRSPRWRRPSAPSPRPTSTPARSARWRRRSCRARRACAPTSKSIRASGSTASTPSAPLAHDYDWAIDLQICVFPQEGLTNDPGTDELLVEACEQGADLIGGCPYTDTDPPAHIARIFDIARRFDLDIDFHLDFDIDPSWMHLDEVCRLTDAHRWGGRVAIGHATKLSAVDHSRLAEIGRRLADAGVAVTVLPATDLFLMGRGARASRAARRRTRASPARSRRNLLARHQ